MAISREQIKSREEYYSACQLLNEKYLQFSKIASIKDAHFDSASYYKLSRDIESLRSTISKLSKKI